MKATVDPLPLVPATWITGGTVLRMVERSKNVLHAVEREVDPLGMQRQEPRQHGVERRRLGLIRAHVIAGSGAASTGGRSNAGALVRSRQRLAMVARIWWRCT